MPSSELTGGAGFTFEDAVAAYYLVALITGTTATGLNPRIVSRVATQQESFGEPLDDIIVDAVSLSDDTFARLSLQVKRTLTISDAASNTDFRDVIQRSWETLQKTNFRENFDRVGALSGTIAEDPFRNFITVCEWARASQSAGTFMQRFVEDGNASQQHREILQTVRNLIRPCAGEDLSGDSLYRLFRHLVLIKLDFLHEGATTEAEVVSKLQRSLVSEQTSRAADLWSQLCQLVRNGSGRSEEFTKGSLLQRLRGEFRFVGSPAFGSDLAILREITKQWLEQRSDTIGGIHIPRLELEEKVDSEIRQHRLTVIKGLPGSGKTAMLKQIFTRYTRDNVALFLSANGLSGRSWVEFARAIGLSGAGIEPLLVEIAATGLPIMFIDGVDRISPEHRPIISDLLGQILSSPQLANWRIIATARDTGIEPLRNWLPTQLMANGGVGYIDVPDLNDQEAEVLGQALPALRPLLQGGDERVRKLARRPFFASVLASGLARAAYPADFAPRSEVDLVEAWWTRGGFDAQAPQALERQRALIELARHSAPDLGRNLRFAALSPSTRAVFPLLEQDGLLQQVRLGHVAQFAHDIFFEWSLFHLLIDEGDGWISMLTKIGEPPALARVVELLSQAAYSDPPVWERNLRDLEGANIRPQWLRAWLLAPFFSQRFNEQVESFTATISFENYRLLRKLIVWMLAEKTTPNPLVLSGQLGGPELDSHSRIRIADALSWPSDSASWARFLRWALDKVETFPDPCLGDLVSLFETWQVVFADVQNQVSKRLLVQCSTWLNAIEDIHQTHRAYNPKGKSDRGIQIRTPTHLESELRALLVRAGRAYPEMVTAYLSKISQFKRIPETTFHEVMRFSPLLAQTHPALLSQVSRNHLFEELPNEAVERWRKEAEEQRRRHDEIMNIPEDQRTQLQVLALASPPMMSWFNRFEWDNLSIGCEHSGYFPASPLREPFHSLLHDAPSIGLALVRDLANHAVLAWRQLHRHLRGKGTPIPLTLQFPWGSQEFWGTAREYLWFRGHFGPHAVNSALMALECWAFEEVKIGKPANEVLQQLLQGHTCIAVLGIAVLVALQTKEVSSVTFPLVTCQRLWHADIQRLVRESEFLSAGLSGFDERESEKPHRKAVSDLGSLPIRRQEIRALVPLFVLCGKPSLATGCRVALEHFPHELGFEYEEEAEDADFTAQLRRTAQIWSEAGRDENYISVPIHGRNDVVGIELRNPHQSDPDVQEVQQRFDQKTQECELWLWVEKCFQTKTWGAKFTVDMAVGRATELSGGPINRGVTSLDADVVHGAIAGTAAAICCFSSAGNHQAWVDQILEKYRDLEEPQSPEIFSKSLIPWHPKIFVAHALAARIQKDCAQPCDRRDLFQLIAHPIELVSLTAIGAVAGCWDRDPLFTWCGINLGLRLSRYHRDPFRDDFNQNAQFERERKRREQALAETLAEYDSGKNYPNWVGPLPAWAQDDSSHGRGEPLPEEAWHRSFDIWIGDYAVKVIRQAPVEKIMASPARDFFLQACEAFVQWTLNTLNPPWQALGRDDRRHEGVELFEWTHGLGQILAFVAVHLSNTELENRLLKPILAQPDDVCMPILKSFTTMFVCLSILDSPQIEDRAIPLLDVCLERTLQHQDFSRKGFRAGEIGGFDLPDLIRALLFVEIQGASSAVRFANGRWNDIPRVMPLIEKIVLRIAWIPFVAQQFVTLCERAGASYPIDAFADQVLAQVTKGSLPEGWKGTRVPSGIAGLIQAHADRHHPLPVDLAQKLLRILDALVDLGDRRSAALQQSEAFRGVRLPVPPQSEERD